MSTNFQPRTSTVPLYGGDYHDRLNQLGRQIEAAEKAEQNTTRTMDEIPESQTLIAEYNTLAAEAEASATFVKLQQVRRSVYRDLAKDHKPRTGNDVPEAARQSDARLGVNEMTFREALVPLAIIDVTENGNTRAWSEYGDDERTDFLDVIGEANFEALFIHAYSLVNSFVSTPKALLSPQSQKSDETLN